VGQIVKMKSALPALALRCSACGSAAGATCDCGVGYVPASEYAAKAVAATPGKTDGAIAAEIGVSHDTVSRARKAVNAFASTDEKRVGKDGKKYPAVRKPRNPKSMEPTLATSRVMEQKHTRSEPNAPRPKVNSAALCQWIGHGRRTLLAPWD
jgi:hypothetical protein